MIKLLKYLKPFLLSLIVAVGLLYVQATTDLELPRYLSDIVNVGIMSDGIEHAAPNVLSEQGMAFVKALVNDEGDALIDSHYVLTPAGDKLSVNGMTITNHPALYALNEDLDEATLASLDQVFGEAVWIVIHIGQSMGSGSGSIDQDNIDFAAIYQIPQMISMLPNGELLLENARVSAAAMDPNLKTQTGIVFVGSVYYADLGIDASSLQMNYIIVTGLWMLGLTLIGVTASILVSLLSSRIGAGVAKALRKDVFAKVESFSSEEFNKFATSSLITRTTNDVTQVQQLIVMSIRMIFYAPIIAFGGIRMIFQTNVNMTWIIGVAVGALILLITVIFMIAIPKFKIIQKLIDKVNLVAREGLSGLMVIRAFGNQTFENERFDKANKDLTKTTLFVNRIITVMMPSMMLIMNLTILSIIWFGSHQVADGNLRIGDMLAFMNYSMQVILSFLMITMMFIFMPRAAVSANRIAEVLETKPVIVDPKEPKGFASPVQGIVRFDNVSFRFGSASENVLSDISFTALPGQTTAIIGSTGSGKSTLINLIPRFHDVTAGSITLDGIDIRDLTQKELRRHISYVPQKGMILSGTIDSNLRYGRPEASEQEIEEAASIAQARGFIEEREEKYQSPISQGGANVSGGQKQRLSIARALVKKAPVIIFDDSFSALDFKTDQLLRRAMHKAVQGATLLIVAQRVGTIMNADQILVMDQGRIVARGTHQELLQSSPIYYEIASSQLAKEELARG
jgi:ATP-binding cassette subfamily B protein